MKLKFKKQPYQTDAVEAVCDCFAGQPKTEPMRYRIDPGARKERKGQTEFQAEVDLPGFRNEELRLSESQLLANIHEVRHRQNLPLSPALVKVPACPVNLDIEMETGNVDEPLLRRIQIREAVRAHFEKEQNLFYQGIKTLSLFFIDEVAKYRRYEEGEEKAGDYAQMFEEEYRAVLNELLELEDSPYKRYLQNIPIRKTHDGYFSIDKKSKQLVDPSVKGRGEEKEADDADAYDLILKNKERLLSFEEPVRFIFSHSALSEGWDNPNVFVICTLKHSDRSIRKRQEVGRGLRLCVNQDGDRIDSGANVHRTNVLTVVASES